MMSQPCLPACAAPGENGADHRGHDRRMRPLQRLGRTPWPISAHQRAFGGNVPVFALDVVGRLDRQIPSTWSMHSRNISPRLAPRLPNTSASDSSPPGLMPKSTARPACDRASRGWRRCGRVGVRHVHRAGAEPDLLHRGRTSVARNTTQEVMFSASIGNVLAAIAFGEAEFVGQDETPRGLPAATARQSLSNGWIGMVKKPNFIVRSLRGALIHYPRSGSRVIRNNRSINKLDL